MSKLNLLLDKLGISLQPLETHLAANANSTSASIVRREDPESYKSFVSRLFVGSIKDESPITSSSSRENASTEDNVGLANTLQKQPIKNVSTFRLIKDVAEHLISSKGSHAENAFVSGFGFRWVFDRGAGGGGGGDDVRKSAQVCEGKLPVLESKETLSQYGQSQQSTASVAPVSLLRSKGGSSFRLEKGTGETSLAFFTTANWRILHLRLGDDLLFELLSTKTIFASCGTDAGNLCQLAGKPVTRIMEEQNLISPKKRKIGKNSAERRKRKARKRKLEKDFDFPPSKRPNLGRRALSQQQPQQHQQQQPQPCRKAELYRDSGELTHFATQPRPQPVADSDGNLPAINLPLVDRPTMSAVSRSIPTMMESADRPLSRSCALTKGFTTSSFLEEISDEEREILREEHSTGGNNENNCNKKRDNKQKKREKLRLLSARRKSWRREVATKTSFIPSFDPAKKVPTTSLLYCEGREALPRSFCLDQRSVNDGVDAAYGLAVHIWRCLDLSRESANLDQRSKNDRVGDKKSPVHDHRCRFFSAPSVASTTTATKTTSLPSARPSSFSSLPSAVSEAFLASLAGNLSSVLRNFKSLHLTSIIDKYCPLSPSVDFSRDSIATSNLVVPPWQVYMAVQFVVSSLFHEDRHKPNNQNRVNWFGSANNRVNFMKKLRTYIVHMGRMDDMTLGYLMAGFRVSEVKWAAPLVLSVAKEEAVAKFLWWLFTSVVNVVLKSFFYITELDHQPRTKVFFRKRVWQRLRASAYCDSFLSSSPLNNFSKISTKEIGERFGGKGGRGGALGFAGLRFVPKEKGLRPILRMSNDECNINNRLTTALNLLKHRRSDYPEVAGVSVFGRYDFFEKFVQFRQKMKREWEGKNFYCVKIDVKDCYQSIDQSRLSNILEGILGKSKDEQMAQPRYQTVSLSGDCLRTKKSSALICLKKSANVPARVDLLTVVKPVDRLYDSIFVDLSSLPDPVPVADLTETLIGHIKNTLIKDRIHGELLMHRGLAAGCVVSSMCCNLYYGDLENSQPLVKEILKDPGSLLVREIDDYLLLTRDISKARDFLRLFTRGFPNYSMAIKKKKTLTNFPFASISFSVASSSSSSARSSPVPSSCSSEGVLTSSEVSARTTPLVITSRNCRNESIGLSDRKNHSNRENHSDAVGPSPWFPWCGFLFHESTLGVRFDLSRYKATYSAKEMKKSVSLAYDQKSRWTINDIKAIVISNVKNLGWALCFSPLVNSLHLRLCNAFDLLHLIYRKIYAMDLRLHHFQNRLHRLAPASFVEIIEMVGLVARSRLESVVRHAQRKMRDSMKTTEVASKTVRPDSTLPDATEPDVSGTPCPTSGNGSKGGESANQNGGDTGNQKTEKVLFGDKNVALWLSYEAAVTALKPNRGQFIRGLKEARKRQRSCESALGNRAKFLWTVTRKHRKK